MEEYKKRMIDEYVKLQDKIIRLDSFTQDSQFIELPDAKKMTIFWQLSAMQSYLKALGSRCILEGISKELEKILKHNNYVEDKVN